MSRRFMTQVLYGALIAASLAFTVAVVAGPVARGAVAAPSTTRCVPIPCGPTTTKPILPTTVPPSTSPATTPAPAPTTPATTAPRTTNPQPRQTFPVTTFAATTTTLTTIPGINGHLPVSPSTLPFTTKQQSAHVNPVFAALSGAGFLVALTIIAVRFLLTRPHRG